MVTTQMSSKIFQSAEIVIALLCKAH